MTRIKLTQILSVVLLVVLLAITTVTAEIPADPVSIGKTSTDTSVNWTWSGGVGNATDTYNVSVTNASGLNWLNGSAAYRSLTNLGSYTTHTVTVRAWNNTGSGNLSTGYLTDSFTTPCLPAGRICLAKLTADINAALTVFWLVPQSIIDHFGILITLVLFGAILTLIGVVLVFIKKLLIRSISQKTGVD